MNKIKLHFGVSFIRVGLEHLNIVILYLRHVILTFEVAILISDSLKDT